MTMSPFSVILVTGGSNSEIGEFSQAVAVEVFSEDGTPLSMCSLPPLPPRFKHTQSGVLACGGYYYSDTTTNCFTLSNEGWYQSHNLREGLVKTRFKKKNSRYIVLNKVDTTNRPMEPLNYYTFLKHLEI